MVGSELAAGVVASFLAGLDDQDLRRTASERIAQLLGSGPPRNARPAGASMRSLHPGQELLFAELQKRVLLGPDLVEPDVIESRPNELVGVL